MDGLVVSQRHAQRALRRVKQQLQRAALAVSVERFRIGLQLQRGEIVLERRLVRAAKVGAAAAVIVPYVHIAQGEVFRRPTVEDPRRTGLRVVGQRHMPGAERQQQKRQPDEERARVLLPRHHDVFEPVAQGAGRGGQAGGEAALVARGL